MPASWRRATAPKTLTALSGAEPLVPVQSSAVQQLQFFLSESSWDADAMTASTLQLLGEDPLTASDANGVLVIDDIGDRKDGFVRQVRTVGTDAVPG